MKKAIIPLLLLFAIVLARPAAASIPTPDAVVKTVIDEVMPVVKSRDFAGDIKKASALAETKVLPHLDMTRMTRLAVGKDWKKATPEQQAKLIEEFRKLLVRTYSRTLAEYKDQTITVKPTKVSDGDNEVVVKTVISQTAAQAIQVEYSMVLAGERWLTYDITVAGVSLVMNYRGTFATEVAANGIEGLIEALKARNSATK